MNIHYNAFISYRHHPDDIRVATEIHRLLEHYHIPKAIRKNQNGPLHLFRDKDELPITSNISDNIAFALENSDYLIVICSTHTKESVWVQREIELFLQTHSHDKVLTVLVDGDPQDTIPEILQYRDKVDPETGEIHRIPIEPLSCDWRFGRKHARREELPRLAAVLLGCSYDELRQRQRQYKMRRLMAIFGAATAASLCLMGYFLHTSIVIRQANENLRAANEEIRSANIQIQANYDAALENQSQYLASAASERYLAGDRLTAVSLAMAALPSAENPRPYVPEAEKILTEAVGIYEPYRGIVADGVMDCGALVEAFVINEETELLYMVDRTGRITAWDAATYQCLGSASLGSSSFQRMQMSGDNLIVLLSPEPGSGKPSLCCFSPQGEQLWSVETCKDFAMLGDNTLMIVNGSTRNEGATVSFLNPATGEQCREDKVIHKEGALYIIGFYQEQYTEESIITLDVGIGSEKCVYVLNLQDDTVNVIKPISFMEGEDSFYIRHVSVTADQKVVAMVTDNSGALNGMYLDMIITSPANAAVLCFEGENWDLTWRQQIETYSYSPVCTMETIPGTDNILCQKDNMFYILEGSTGKILAKCEASADICEANVKEDGVTGVLADGRYFLYDYADNHCGAIQLNDDDILQAEAFSGKFYTLNYNSCHVSVYRNAEMPEWTVLEAPDQGYLVKKRVLGNRVMTIDSNSSVKMFDLQTDCCIWEAILSSGYGAEILDMSSDGKAVYVKQNSDILAFDTETGDMRIMPILKEVEGTAAYSCGLDYGKQDWYCYLLRMENSLYLAAMDLRSGESTLYPFLMDVEGSSWSIGAHSSIAEFNEEYIWVWDEGTLYEVSRGTGKINVIVSDLTEYPLCTYHETEGLLSVGTGNTLVFYRPGGVEFLQISLGENKASGVCIRGNMLLVVTNEGLLCRYDMAGNCISQTMLDVYTNFNSQATPSSTRRVNIEWIFTDNGNLVINAAGLGNIVDCSKWETRAYVLNYVGYAPESNKLICNVEGQLGYFPLYTTEQVMEIAREQLGDYTLPDETKEYYGIS